MGSVRNFFPVREFEILNTRRNVWGIQLKNNCLQLKWEKFNHFKMCNSAVWAHHSRPVDFSEHNSRPQRTMCTSSIVHVGCKALTFLRVGTSAIWLYLSPICPSCFMVMLINFFFFGATGNFATEGLSWFNDWAEGSREWYCILPGDFWWKWASDCINSALLLSQKVDSVTFFRTKLRFAWGRNKII